MPRIEHAPGCVLDPVHWLRHAIAAAGRLVSPQEDDDVRHVDRWAAGLLLDTLAHFAELPDWATVTLEDVCAAGRRAGHAVPVAMHLRGHPTPEIP